MFLVDITLWGRNECLELIKFFVSGSRGGMSADGWFASVSWYHYYLRLCLLVFLADINSGTEIIGHGVGRRVVC